MEQKTKTHLLIDIVEIILLSWMFHFNSDVGMFDMSLNKHCNCAKEFEARNYRLLGGYKYNIDSKVIFTKEEMPNIVLTNKKDICNSEEGLQRKVNKSNGCSPSITRSRKKDMNKKSCTFETKKYSHLEKKIFKELDYENFLKKNRTITDKMYKKIMLKKYRLRLTLPLLFFSLLLIIFLVDLSWDLIGGNEGLWGALGLSTHLKILADGSLKNFLGLLKTFKGFWKPAFKEASTAVSEINILWNLFGILIYFIPFVILGFTLILGIIYHHKKVKKYEKIKFRKR
ncbi:fam-l protein [Plasmodium malariae]|uniref:Fam-l protein n=1 Tax=Plasmodium malariae TaxID=5858 RepID=A0A1D3JHD3_PLAMA|nr:fam-l protein [Plasmodium malariae]SBT85725.1 fam-l protein [Plasmodium malariae]